MPLPSLPDQPMDYFENLYTKRGFQRIAGVDEVGRGPLAGPVLAAAVILPRTGVGQRLFDSKQISAVQLCKAQRLRNKRAPQGHRRIRRLRTSPQDLPGRKRACGLKA